LQHHLLTVGSSDDPFGQPLPHVREDVSQARGLVPAAGAEPRIAQRGLHRIGDSFHAVFLVGEKVDVLGGPGDDTVRQQRVAATEREPVPGRRAQGDDSHPAVQIAERHQADAAAPPRSTGCSSSHACRTPLGR